MQYQLHGISIIFIIIFYYLIFINILMLTAVMGNLMGEGPDNLHNSTQLSYLIDWAEPKLLCLTTGRCAGRDPN